MAAPKGNKFGKRFSETYQPPEKWTEERALEVAFNLLDWLRAEDENIFFKDYLHLKNSYPKNIVKYLSDKFKSFREVIEDAKNIQEIKLVKFGVFDKLNSGLTKHVLDNVHGWTSQKIETKQEINQGIKVNVIDNETENELNKLSE